MTSNNFIFENNNKLIDEKDFNMPSFNLENEKTNSYNASLNCPLENYEKNDKELNFLKEDDNKKLMFPSTNKTNKEVNLDGKLKMNSIFRINRIPFYEKNINEIIEKMNINQEKEKLIILNCNDNYEEINNIRNKLFMKGKLRMKKQDKDLKFIVHSKRGRKAKNDNSNRIHNKYQPDNIIKSIKTKLNHSLLLFLNKLINSIYNKTQIVQILSELNLPKIKKDRNLKILKLIKESDYDLYINNTSKSYNLKLLNLTISNYISKSISRRFKKVFGDYNKLIIKKLLDDEQNKDIFNFIFTYLKVEDWLDIFLHKKEIDNYIDNNKINESKINIIKENLVRIDDCFLEMYNDDKLYFHCFVLMIYNFKRYFLLKEGRALKNQTT